MVAEICHHIPLLMSPKGLKIPAEECADFPLTIIAYTEGNHAEKSYGAFQAIAIVDDERLSAEEMDERRRQNIAYEYLCHLEEAKRWMEVCLDEELPPTTELEEGLRNGVYLAKLAKFFAPKLHSGLHFRHTDNTVQWLRAMESIGLPKIFYPETTDVYDRKNIPRMIYCIHALSLYLFKLGIAPQIQDLLGKVDFTEEEISNMRKELEKYGIQMPSFSKIGVIAINEAIEKGNADQTIKTLQNPNAMLVNVDDNFAHEYQKELSGAKKKKEENARLKSDSILEEERDVYEELLTQAEIQGNINKVNQLIAVDNINIAIRNCDSNLTIAALMKPEAQLPEVYPSAASVYQTELFNLQQQNAMKYLAHDELSIAVEMLSAVVLLNQALESKNIEAIKVHLSNPSIGFNSVEEENLQRYADTLLSIKLEALSQGQQYLSWNDIQNCIDMAIDRGDPIRTIETLLFPTAKLQNVKEANAWHYQAVLNDAKTYKCQESRDNSSMLWLDEIQKGIDDANQNLEEASKLAIGICMINQGLEKGDSASIITILQSRNFNLKAVPECAEIYYERLQEAKNLKTKEPDEGPWIKFLIQGSYDYYFNEESGEGTCTPPEGITPKTSWLSGEEIQKIVSEITSNYNREQLWFANEDLIIQLQAKARGFLVRKKYKERKAYLQAQEPSVIKIQAFWKGYKQKKNYSERLQMLQRNVASITKIQSWVKMWLARRAYKERIQYFKDHLVLQILL
ncbi:putative Ras GTPase-activating-like protein [Naja naja]|nr:putative Ras GTPase-activating-like protein [Naja naja]